MTLTPTESKMKALFSAVAVMGIFSLTPNAHANIDIAQSPVFVSAAVPPLNMLVMGRDHKLYYEAYNDASDLNGDGKLDVGYRGYLTKANGGIDYYGYFNSKVCYTHNGTYFAPAQLGGGDNGKECSGQWSGDFLNYLTTSRMDALRKVLYGGYRSTDSSSQTILQGAFIPQDAHSWGKEYQSVARDGYDIRRYTNLALPSNGFYHLFAVTSTTDNTAPKLRVLNNTSFRIWNWVSKERTVADSTCVSSTRATVSCTTGGPATGWAVVPSSEFSGLTLTTWPDNIASPTSTAQMDTLFNATNSANSNKCGSQSVTTIKSSGTKNSNPFNGAKSNCTNDKYHTLIEGTLTPTTSGSYLFSIDGDDAVDVYINGSLKASWYNGHGATHNGNEDHSFAMDLVANQNYTIKFRHEEEAGDDEWGFYWKPADAVASRMVDYNIRVEACPSNETLRESNCKAYPSGAYKPTGILHDYGETNRMYFGLLSGSYKKNMSGGTLRSNIQSFANELDLQNGQFRSNVSGIVDTINKFRTYDFLYNSHEYGCGFINSRAMIQSDTCYMWGNPIGEMMYETMRYFAGATTPTSAYDYTDSGSPDNAIGLPKPDWTPPYANINGGRNAYPGCAVPAMTVISDINPSYDVKLPGAKQSWQADNTAFSSTGDPTAISTLNVSEEVDAIWEAEGGGTRSIFIGESNGVSDGAPTEKEVSNLSTVRGLAPEEPTKSGTYYSAGVSRFGARHNIGGDKKLLTYSVALASPLPKIEFPVNGKKVTVVPFAKSVQTSYAPTNQIVDFYVEQIANTDTQNANISINNGRPYAKFRINYEDVEQGADHDMDAIALYTLSVNSQGTLDIRLDSEYAAGSALQNMGYVISGTTHDGVYLEICDLQNDSTTTCNSTTTFYKLNTPPGRAPNYCVGRTNDNECKNLPISTSRNFSASTTPSASLLKDPLWYAAKYGTTATNWDSDSDGTPDNYFLVTNALTLKAQLDKAFGDLDQRQKSITRPAAGREPQSNSTATTQATYRTEFDTDDWSGDLIKETRTSANTITSVWKASANIPATRNIYMNNGSNTGSKLSAFSWATLDGKSFAGVNLRDSLNINPVTNQPDSDSAGAYGQARVKFIRGESCTGLSGCGTFRIRNKKIGDIVGSSPVLVSGAQYLNYVADSLDGAAGTYASFKTAQAARTPIVYVGANDGMLHGFNANTGAETFAFIPTPVIPTLNQLTRSDYTSQTNDNHRYYVDGSLSVTDVYFGSAWHTVLVGTLGAGGRGVFALDVTDPESIKLLWEFTSDTAASKSCDASNNCVSDLGQTLATPVVARLHSNSWAAVIPNGYNSPNNGSGKAVLFVLDIQTGALLKKLDAFAATGTNGLSTPKLADNNSDGVADYAYAGDLQGNMWRFDLLQSEPPASAPFARTADASSIADQFRVAFGGAPLYSAQDSDSNAQPITSAPALIRHPSRLGYIVAFGTGRYLGTTDKVSPFKMQTLYGVWDRQTKGEEAGSTPTLTRAKLQEQTITSESLGATFGSETRDVRILSNTGVSWYSTTNTSGKYGWRLDLSASTSSNGERIVDDPIKRGDVLIVGSRTPNSDPCESGMDGFYYGINPATGGRTTFNVFDLNGDGVVNSLDSSGTPISGVGASNVGGNTLISGPNITDAPCLLDSTGKCTNINLGSGSSGRQSWRVLPGSAL